MEHFKGITVPNDTVLDEKRAGEELRGYIRARIGKMQERMRAKNIDAAIMLRPENIFYFSNFNPIIISHVPYFLLTQERAVLLVHAIRHDHAVNEGAIDTVLCYGKWGDTQVISIDAYKAIRKIFTESLGKDNTGPIRLGIEGDYASWGVCEKLRSVLSVSEFADIAQDAADLRLVKDPYEIGLCRISGILVDVGVTTAIEALKAGASEQECATEGQYAMRRLWQERYNTLECSGFSNSETAAIDTFVVWCMSNDRLNYGCDCPTRYVPQPGDLTMPMSWARVGGYNVENERTLIVGYVNETRTRAYDAMLRARDRIFHMIRPGAVFEDLYIEAMKIYEDAGFGSILPGRCGHGMGISTHEFPSVTKGNTRTLEPGMIFTVEPGLMSAQLGAVRNSDTVLVTEEGFEFLTNSDRDKIIIKGV